MSALTRWRAAARKQWEEFRRGRPGRRFQERFERGRQGRSDRNWPARFFKPAAGVLLLVAGVIFCCLPGPGIPLLVVGGCLLADVSRRAARLLDGLEAAMRKIMLRIRIWWARRPAPGKCTAGE